MRTASRSRSTAGNIQPASDIAQAVAAMLSQVGIKVRTNIVPQGNYFPKIEKFDTSFYVLSWGGGITADALYTLQALLHTPNKKGEGDFNMGRWSNARMDELIQQLQVERDAAKRDAIVREALAARGAGAAAGRHPPAPHPLGDAQNVSAWFSPVNTLYFYRVRID